MLLFGIEAESPGRELLSFECPQCQNIETRSRQKRVGHDQASGTDALSGTIPLAIAFQLQPELPKP